MKTINDENQVSGAEVRAMSRDSKGKKWEDYDTIKCLDGTIIDMKQLVRDQASAKAALIHLEPMFATFANMLNIVYTFRIRTQATDGYHLFVNPQFTAELTFTEKVFVMAHECMHCVFDHMRRGRQAGHDHRRSNVAADYEVNQTLVDLGLFKAETIKNIKALIDSKYSGWAYERVYDDRPKDPSNKNNNNNQPGQSQSGWGQSGQGQTGQSDGGQNQGQVTPQDCDGSFGADMPDTPGGFMDAKEGKDLAKREGHDDGVSSDDAIAKDWKDAALKAAKQKMHGDTAGGFIEKLNAIWKTNHDWKRTFKKIIGRSLNTQDRRQAFANKNVLATRGDIMRTDKDKFDAVDYICMFVDSSGSMSNQQLSIAAAEVYNIALALKPIVMVYGTFDTRVNDVQTFTNAGDFKKYVEAHGVNGRGGTDAKSVFNFLKTDKRFKGKTSELVIIVSDGDYSCSQCKRDPKTMSNLCWVMFDCPGWDTDLRDARTSVVHLNSGDIN